jgi:hypothetical protein
MLVDKHVLWLDVQVDIALLRQRVTGMEVIQKANPLSKERRNL